MASFIFYFLVSFHLLYLPMASFFTCTSSKEFSFSPVSSTFSCSSQPWACSSSLSHQIFTILFFNLFPFILLFTDDIVHSNSVQNSGTIMTEEEVWMSAPLVCSESQTEIEWKGSSPAIILNGLDHQIFKYFKWIHLHNFVFCCFKGQERQKYFRNKGINSPPLPIKLATKQEFRFLNELTAN